MARQAGRDGRRVSEGAHHSLCGFFVMTVVHSVRTGLRALAQGRIERNQAQSPRLPFCDPCASCAKKRLTGFLESIAAMPR